MQVELRDVTKRFGNQPVLRGVTASIDSGERVALVGPNGSGKSTLLRAIMGLLRCEGSVRLDGRCPFTHRDQTAQELAYVPQAAPQLGASVDDVITAVTTLRGLQRQSVAQYAAELDLELHAIGNRPFRALSGGMKQKLLLALAFASKARLFIFDEPTASLDLATRERFLPMLEALRGQSTVIVCSHRMEEVQPFVERVIELAEGRVARDLRCLPSTQAMAGGKGAT
jgi:ABC-type multidrug transport system ATPase subunit